MVRTSVAGGGWFDLGGQWIRPTHVGILELAEQLGIPHFDFYAVGQTTVSYDRALSVVDDFPPENVIPSVSATDIAEANQVWERFYALAATMNIESPWLSPDAMQLDSQRRSQRGWTMPQRPNSLGSASSTGRSTIWDAIPTRCRCFSR